MWINFNPAYISNQIDYKIYVITYPYLNINSSAIEVWE